MQGTTYKPNKRKRLTTHGFRSRMETRDGRAVLSRRRAKGRKKLTVSDSTKKFISHHHAPFLRKIKALKKNSTGTEKRSASS